MRLTNIAFLIFACLFGCVSRPRTRVASADLPSISFVSLQENPKDQDENEISNGSLLFSSESQSSEFLRVDDSQEPVARSVFERWWQDQSHFYSSDSLANLGVAFGAGAVLANTTLDHQITLGLIDAAVDGWVSTV